MSGGEARVALVTGASAGLGQAVAEVLARRGLRVIVTGRRLDRLEILAQKLRAEGAQVEPVAADLADPETPRRLVEAALAAFGRLDVIVNNAGFGLPGLYSDEATADLRTQLLVNLGAPVLIVREALPHLIATRGTVINVGSAITAVANPSLGLYGTTKAGLAYFSAALRRELWHKGVHVCHVEPGPVETEFFDAVIARSRPGERALGVLPQPDWVYNPLRDRPLRIMEASLPDAARRIADLVDRPRRRLSFLRRMVWPWRVTALVMGLCPPLLDRAVSSMVVRIERERARATRDTGGQTAGRS